jgi:hypothetical protein
MNVAILCESDADAAALRVLTEAILEMPIAPVTIPRRHSGWPAVRNLLTAIMKGAYWSEADALVVVADSDESPVHSDAHLQTREPKCRFCYLREEPDACIGTLSRRASGRPFQVVIGLAVPCLEAWLLADRNPHVSETAWITGVAARKPPYTRQALKTELYGTDRPSLALETTKMQEAAQRVVIQQLEVRFPNGFAPFAQALRLLKS